jgi:hypothetical protein
MVIILTGKVSQEHVVQLIKDNWQPAFQPLAASAVLAKSNYVKIGYDAAYTDNKFKSPQI